MSDLGKMGVTLPEVMRALAHALQYKTTGRDRSEEPWVNDPAHDAGLKAVAEATDPSVRREPDASAETTHAMGMKAVDKAMDDYSIEAWKERMKAARNAKRASAAGEAAVGKAADEESAKQAEAMRAQMTKDWAARMAFDKSTKGMAEPDRVRAIIAAGKGQPEGYGPREGQLYAQTFGPAAVEEGLKTPPGGYAPGEAAMYAQTFGPAAVEQALKGGPLPMSPPGHPFGPQSVVNPEMETTEGADEPYSWNPNTVRGLGMHAVKKAVEE